MKNGFQTIRKRYPDSLWDMNSYCYFASIGGDRETAAKLFKKIDGRWDEDVWGSKEHFNQWANWATETKSATPEVKQ
jgi:hypothetical protein